MSLVDPARRQGVGKPRRSRSTPSTDPRTPIFLQICAKELGVECVPEYRFHPKRLWRFDYAFPIQRIALEVEGGVWTGGRHTSARGFLGDIEKYNEATLLGWRLLRTTPADLLRTSTICLLRRAIEATL